MSAEKQPTLAHIGCWYDHPKAGQPLAQDAAARAGGGRAAGDGDGRGV